MTHTPRRRNPQTEVRNQTSKIKINRDLPADHTWEWRGCRPDSMLNREWKLVDIKLGEDGVRIGASRKACSIAHGSDLFADLPVRQRPVPLSAVCGQ
jgi:hypothetical protein